MFEGRIKVLAGSKSDGSMSDGSESESETSSRRACRDIFEKHCAVGNGPLTDLQEVIA